MEREKEGNSQVKELIEHWMQCLKFHLCALTLCHGEEVVRTELYYDKWVTQT